MDLSAALIAAAIAVPFVFAGLHLWRRSRRHEKASAALEKGHGDRIPLTLHPVIDPEICIGSLSCLKACPEGDILGVIDGAARLIHADHCIGHGKCAAECPVGAIKLVFGTAERGVDLPSLDEFFESSRPGVHVVGELGGMGLIKNAVEQGLQVSRRIAAVLPRTASPDGVVDVAIVGAGPAGLATALGLRQADRSFRVLEQEAPGGTISQYPRQKLVMTEPLELPFYGRLRKKRISKEKLLAVWQKALGKARIEVESGVKVAGIEGDDGAFELATSKGPVRARKIVLATGRRGTPRKLGCPGEELAKVTYRLIDPEQYEGARVLVVGGGDAALEAAIQLAESGGVAEVGIAYRGDGFARCREANRTKIAALGGARKVRVMLGTEVESIAPGHVRLRTPKGTGNLPNDFVIVCIGGELPLEFLAKSGVKLERFHGEDRRGRKVRAAPAKDRRIDHPRRREHLLYLLLGTLIIGWLASVGWSYYLLPHVQRLRSPLHAALKPSGTWGHWVGIWATAVMLCNFLYPLRKRSRFMQTFGPIREWLDFHTFVGFMSPLVIVFHAAFQSNNQLATATAASLLIVVMTGIIGRFIYGLVPSQGGKALEMADLLAKFERTRARLAAHSQLAPPNVSGHSLVWLFLRMPFDALFTRARLLRERFHFDSRDEYAEFRDDYLQARRLQTQVAFFQGLKRLMRTWRVFHASLAVFLVVAIAAHIGVSMYLGYGWRR
ncbi:MAG TPA: NAD(P)-binding domain-containing protein [Myxococcales bacterium]|nr:NAD(P)-binding domain-containing protein [Myxococcales bacterium]